MCPVSRFPAICRFGEKVFFDLALPCLCVAAIFSAHSASLHIPQKNNNIYQPDLDFIADDAINYCMTASSLY
jgi:hypothetical protein